MEEDHQYDQQHLAIYRTTLRHLLDQAAKFGGEAMAPVPIMGLYGATERKRSFSPFFTIHQGLPGQTAGHPRRWDHETAGVRPGECPLAPHRDTVRLSSGADGQRAPALCASMRETDRVQSS
jgi:hypothetical protein